jgi:hypothetical protein
VFAVCFGLPDPVHRYSYGRLKAAADQINQAAESTCSPHDGSSDGPASVDVLRGRIHLERRIGVALVSLEDRPLLEDGTMLASDACNRG